MKRITLLVLVLVAFATSASAQWGWMTDVNQKAQAGFSMDTLDRGDQWWENDKGTWKSQGYKYPTIAANWHFNSSYENTFDVEGSTAGVLSTVRKASTRKGWWVGAYDGDGRKVQSANIGAKVENISGGGDPAIFANVDTVRAYLSEPTLTVEGSAPGPLNKVDSLQAVVLALDKIGGANSNRALAAYPGKWRKTDIRFGLNFASDTVKSDVAFTLIPLGPGNDGSTTTYKVVISIVPGANTGSGYNNTNTAVDKIDSTYYGTTGVPYVSDNTATNGVRRFVIENVITADATKTIGDSVRFSLVEKTGLPYDSLSRKKIVIAIIGESTGTITPGKYAPFVGIDNVTVNNAINKYNSSLDTWTNVDPTQTGIFNVAASTTKVIGQKGQIEITGAQADVTVYNITGQKIVTVAKGDQVVSVPAGVYLVAEQNQRTVKVIVK